VKREIQAIVEQHVRKTAVDEATSDSHFTEGTGILPRQFLVVFAGLNPQQPADTRHEPKMFRKNGEAIGGGVGPQRQIKHRLTIPDD
jgi:hypothetical protein